MTIEKESDLERCNFDKRLLSAAPSGDNQVPLRWKQDRSHHQRKEQSDLRKGVATWCRHQRSWHDHEQQCGESTVRRKNQRSSERAGIR